jgi:hypothetical protein
LPQFGLEAHEGQPSGALISFMPFVQNREETPLFAERHGLCSTMIQIGSKNRGGFQHEA